VAEDRNRTTARTPEEAGTFALAGGAACSSREAETSRRLCRECRSRASCLESVEDKEATLPTKTTHEQPKFEKEHGYREKTLTFAYS
jgi:hypothetical protein